MIRDQVLAVINKKILNGNIVKHMLAMEAFMGTLADYLGEDRQSWSLAGLVHDLDYLPEIEAADHGLKVEEMLHEENLSLPGEEEILQAVAAHNWHNNGINPKSKLDWALFCGDSLTGLVVACALVLPEKSLGKLSVESVLKKFPQKRFAAGTRREDIKLCEEKLGIPLEKFVEICLSAMQAISDDLGL